MFVHHFRCLLSGFRVLCWRSRVVGTSFFVSFAECIGSQFAPRDRPATIGEGGKKTGVLTCRHWRAGGTLTRVNGSLPSEGGRCKEAFKKEKWDSCWRRVI